ncbi:MAG: HIT domain-containing protein [Candidatus Freyarchaeota archaeon]|nr:HIT domain-containing protein [Candidatus Jordarchaeia archaeon]
MVPLDVHFPSYILVPDKADYVRGRRPQVDCILCALAREDPAVEPMILAKKGDFVVALNRYPYNPGHLMVFPERHLEAVEELGEDEVKQLFTLVQRCIRLLKEVYSPHGFNVGINQGRAAGASIAHLHVHVVPRYLGELSFIDLTGSRVIVENLKTTLEKLKSKAEILNN